uniref:GIY-YIG nuclease family protein n=1 Tax=Ningiella ruwaisensis TaxID=2364274 RepID=UPI00109FF1D1|nr:GIY-YIG nuclease family protein [Ningiella ruwaisensis]
MTKIATVESTSPSWFLYVIETAHGNLYTGITTDVRRRYKEHCDQSAKTAKALRGKAPLSLRFVCVLNSHSDALKAEIWLKKQRRKIKERIINQQLSIPFEHNPLTQLVDCK